MFLDALVAGESVPVVTYLQKLRAKDVLRAGVAVVRLVFHEGPAAAEG